EISNVEAVITHEWKGVTADQITANFTAEATEAADSSPTLVQPDILLEKAQCFIPVSIELFQDWTNLQANLARLLNDAKNNLESAKCLAGVGHGSFEPGGILNIGGTNGLTTTQRVQTTTVATYAVGDPWLLKAAIPPRFLASSTFASAPA